MFKRIFISIVIILVCWNCFSQKSTKPFVLKANSYKHYVDYFNRMEDENIKQAIPNDSVWNWMKKNIPLFECPQQNFEEIFYYRWWTLRKHIKQKKDLYLQSF